MDMFKKLKLHETNFNINRIKFLKFYPEHKAYK